MKPPKLPPIKAASPLGANKYECRAFFADIVEPFFNEWMRGQTQGIDEVTGQPVVYRSDLDSFGEGLQRTVARAFPQLMNRITD